MVPAELLLPIMLWVPAQPMERGQSMQEPSTNQCKDEWRSPKQLLGVFRHFGSCYRPSDHTNSHRGFPCDENTANACQATSQSREIEFELPHLVRSLAGTSCFSTLKNKAHMDGDVMVAGFFPLYTLGTERGNSDASSQEEHKLVIFKNYQSVLALAFAIEEINKNPDLLYSLSLGFDVYNVHHAYWGLTFGPFDHALSDHNKFPALYQMAKKDTSIAAAMVSLLLHFSWTWVGLLTSQDENASESDCVTWDSCPPDASLDLLPGHMFDMTMSADSYTIYNTVYAVAQALHEMLLHQTEVQTTGKREGTVSFTEQTPHSVCSESCGLGFRKSPQEGKATCCFDCTSCPHNEIANETDMEQCVMCADHQYANTQRDQCLLRAASFLAFGDPLGMALACMALCFSMLTAAVLGMFVKHQDTAIVKANNRALSYILLISLIFCFLCALLFIGRPNTVTCILQQITFGVVFMVAVSTVLAKTLTVVLAFKATCPGRRMRRLLVSGAPNLIIPICTLIQLSLCGLCLGSSPPFVDTDAHSEHGHIIILCNKGSLTAFYCVLGYLGSLALASFMAAFLARNLPDTFNEARFLTFSMLVFCSVWLTFLPVYHSAKGKVMVAVEVFSILASGAGLLGCIFAPKCYIIMLIPHKMSLHGFRDKRHSSRH
ncbi:vomeronasal type-2 receptor 116-like [Thomomys bottae]